MKGLILKDLYNLKKYSKSVLAVLGVYIVIFGIMGDNLSMISTMTLLMTMMTAITTFSYDDLAKWDALALTFPITRREVVRAKYILAGGMCGLGALFSLLVSGAVFLYKGGEILEILTTILVCFLLALFYVALLLPLLYKFGAEKSRILMVLVFLLPAVVAFLVFKFNQEFFRSLDAAALEGILKAALPIAGIFALLLIFGSYFLSCRIYEKKEL